MNKAIKKSIFARVLLGLMLFLLVGVATVSTSTLTAHAAAVTTPNYSMQFNWTKTTTTGTGGGTGSSTSTGTGYSVYVQTSESYGATVSVSIYGDGSSGTGTFAIGSYIRSSTVNIQINSSLSSGTIKVTNSSGTQIASGGKSVTMTGLADGTYNVTFGFGGGAWATSARSGTGVSVSGSSSFKVDCTAPSISGAATTTTGKYTNAAFTVSSSDSGSGVQALYMKSPSDSSYSSVGGSSKTVAASSTNGLYSFYAKDNAGNQSNTYYVYLDTTKPTVTATSNKTYTNGSFQASASDTGSGVDHLEYKTPTATSWATYNPSIAIRSSETNGKYTFRAIDKAGNISNEKAVYLDTGRPTGTLYSGTTQVASGSKVNGEYIKFVGADTLSGILNCWVMLPDTEEYVTYTNGSQYAAEGTYSFKCRDNAGNISPVYTITLDKTKPDGKITTASNVELTGNYIVAAFKYVVTDDGSGLASVEYKTPGSSTWTSYTSGTLIAATATNGLYQFRATDEAGNVSDVKSITLDNTKPTGQVYGGTTALASGSYTNAGSIKFVTSDATSGVKSAYVKGPGATTYSAYTSGSTYTAEGTYYFYSVDNAGNTSATYSITLALTKPTIIIADANGTVKTNGSTNLKFRATGTDKTSGLKSFQYMSPTDTTWKDYTRDTYIESNAGDGVYRFRAEDKAGNVADTVQIVLDTTKPTVTIYGGTTVLSNGANTNAANVSFSASDSGSGLKRMYVKLPSSTSYAIYTAGTKYTDNGKYYFYCTDNAGNTSDTYTVTFDSSKPTGSIKDGTGAVLTAAFTNKSFSYSATDDGVGIDKLQYTTPTNSSWTTYSSGTIIPTTATNGKYQFRAVDKAGNLSEVKSITLDTTKPTGTLYGGATVLDSGNTTNAGYIKFISADNSSGVSKTYVKAPNATTYAEYTSGNQLTDNGTYTFYCEDKAGNTSVTYTIKLDNIAPSLTCSQSAFFEEYDNTFTVSVSDALGTASLYYKTTKMTSYAKASVNTYTVRDTEPNGKYYFYATDDVGNVSQNYWIELNVVYPTATINTDSNSNVVSITWDDDSTGQLNGALYSKNTNITKEGNYTFVLTSKKNRSTTYTFALTHSYYVDEVIAPTCTEQGYSVYRCLSCESYYHSDYVDALGHDYQESTIQATCTTEGGIHHTCARCGDEYVTDTVRAFGHTYFEYTVEPTCTEDGCVRHECSVCGYTYDTEIVKATGHDYVTEVSRAATCTEDGKRTHLCRKCGDIYETEIPAFGHTYEITDVEGEGGVTIRTYTCEVCGDTYQQDLGNQYEEVSNYVEYLFQQYRPYMVYVFLGTSGVWSIAMGIAIIIAKKNDEKEKAKKMLVNYGIGMVIIFAILIAIPFLVRGIAALVAA